MNNLYTDYFYNFLLGEHPSDEAFIKTKNIFDYLEDSNLTESEILATINKLPTNEVITIDDLPDDLWNDSLLKRGTFYFHKELQITSPPPTWDESFPFYLEMKIKYTEEDILEYFIKKAKIYKDWVNEAKEIGSIKFLLKEYKKFSFVEPIDFLLHLIDYCIADTNSYEQLTSIYDIRDKEIEFAKLFEVDIQNARFSKKDRIIWRK